MDEKTLQRYLGVILSPGSQCPSSSELYAFSQGRVDIPEREKIEVHLLTCSDCLEQWRDLRVFMLSETSAPFVQSRVSRRSGVMLALAASLFLAIGLGLILGQFIHPFGQRTGYAPHIASLVDLYPQSMVFRGGNGNVIEMKAEQPELWSFVLNTDQSLAESITVELWDLSGEILWQAIIGKPESPLCVLVPTSLLTEGNYRILVRNQQGDEIEIFLFRAVQAR